MAFSSSTKQYGAAATAPEVISFIRHILEGGQPIPICIWGKHGIGKTEMVQAIAKDIGFQLVQLAPAQFEEMGDLVGMPAIENNQTVFRAPAWVPKEKGPGILLLDDFNRADDRILRGLMPLMQDRQLVSWNLPDQWQIILTANPNDGGYSVTPMDDAMLTRMLHITLQFDLMAWVSWADANQIDNRGINFVITHPEILEEERTTPRTLVQFFQLIKGIPNLREQLPLVRLLAASSLDQRAAQAFVTFVNHHLDELPSPTQILNSKRFKNEVEEPLKRVVQQDTLRVDILSNITNRLVKSMENTLVLTPYNINNVKAFFSLSFLSKPIRFKMAQDLMKLERKELEGLMSDPIISGILLEGF